jgi:hypothetical protein
MTRFRLSAAPSVLIPPKSLTPASDGRGYYLAALRAWAPNEYVDFEDR